MIKLRKQIGTRADDMVAVGILKQHFCFRFMLGNRTSSEPNYPGALPRDKLNGEEVKKLMDDD
jgi:hypothetical protein